MDISELGRVHSLSKTTEKVSVRDRNKMHLSESCSNIIKIINFLKTNNQTNKKTFYFHSTCFDKKFHPGAKKYF